MKKILLFFGFLLGVLQVNSQSTNELYTVVSKYNPDAVSTTRLGRLNPTSGIVTQVGTDSSPNMFNITGGSLNQTTNRFNLISLNSILSFDLLTGDIVSEIPITSFFDGFSTFANVRFTNSNNKLYGLASTFTEENQLIGMYLAELNSENGILTQLSTSSIGSGYQLAGTAIDPIEMVYYYSTGTKFMGIDLYNGSIYSNPDIVFSDPNDFTFVNFSYNCSDATMYGMIVKNTQLQNPNLPFPSPLYEMRFGKINPTTGVVTTLSDVPLPTAVYSVNASATIDPVTETYYFSDGAFIYGVSLETGLITSTVAISSEEGAVINMLTNYNNCLGAIALRPNTTLSLTPVANESQFRLSPNPTSSLITISTTLTLDRLEIVDMQGKTIKISQGNSRTITVEDLQTGIYFIKLFSGDITEIKKFVKI